MDQQRSDLRCCHHAALPPGPITDVTRGMEKEKKKGGFFFGVIRRLLLVAPAGVSSALPQLTAGAMRLGSPPSPSLPPPPSRSPLLSGSWR